MELNVHMTDYREAMFFTFGCGGAGVLLSAFLLRYHTLMAAGFMLIGLTGIGFGVTTVMTKRGYLDPDGLARLSPAVGLVLAIIVIYAAFNKILKESGNKELHKLSGKMTIAFAATMVGLFALIALLLYGEYCKPHG